MEIMAGPQSHVEVPQAVGSPGADAAAGCSRSVGHEGRDLTLTLACKDCARAALVECAGPRSPLSDPRCLGDIIEALSAEPDADTLILAGHIETQLRGPGMQALKGIVSLAGDLSHLSSREPPAGRRDCGRCGLEPRKLFGELRRILLADIASFPDALRGGMARVQSAASAPPDQACAGCASDTSGDIAFAAEAFNGLAGFIMKQGFQVVVSGQDTGNPDELRRNLPRALDRTLERSQRIRPGFSQSWVAPSPPDDSEPVMEYAVGDSRVAVLRPGNDTELLYHLVPFEYSLPAGHIRLLDDARQRMMQTVPQLRHFRRPEQARSYVQREGTRIISQLAQEKGVRLGATRALQLAGARRLAGVLARYPAGLGITEYFLEDPNVQDVYMDAPAHLNPVYVTLGGLADPRARGRCRTNVSLGAGDAESLLSRFRFGSGRPFSEARPYLETDIQGYSTRVTVIGKPLSPEGVAIALRRHSTDPWTLPRLVAAKSLTPLAAGLLSFLVDGQSTILVAGSRGAGKTSLVGALMLEFPRSQRILTIEDTLELPAEAMKCLGYKLQSMQVRSSLGGMGEMSADEALRLSLRLGESAIVMGEVRGQEARTLYEAMRAGTAGSSVLGTIHGNSAMSVHERVVHDMGIPPKAFSATDIVVVAGLRRPFGAHRSVRRITEISEVVKDSDGQFRELMAYDEGADQLVEKGDLASSERIRAIARSFNFTPEQAVRAIRLRAQVLQEMVSFAAGLKNDAVLGARWVADANDALWGALERHPTDFSAALDEWRAWFGRRTAGL